MSELNRLHTGDSLALENRFANRAGGMVASEIRAPIRAASRRAIARPKPTPCVVMAA